MTPFSGTIKPLQWWGWPPCIVGIRSNLMCATQQTDKVTSPSTLFRPTSLLSSPENELIFDFRITINNRTRSQSQIKRWNSPPLLLIGNGLKNGNADWVDFMAEGYDPGSYQENHRRAKPHHAPIPHARMERGKASGTELCRINGKLYPPAFGYLSKTKLERAHHRCICKCDRLANRQFDSLCSGNLVWRPHPGFDSNLHSY